MISFYDMIRLMEVETLQKPDPVPLSQVDSNVAKVAVVSGQKDNDMKDDTIQANMKASGPVGALSPTQSTLVSDKVINFALAYLGGEPWMDLKQMDAIVSQDNAIMDGHHRWAAALIVDPNMQVGFTRVNLQLEKLISILNVYSKGKLGVQKGNPDAGETIAQAFANIEQKIRQAVQNGFKFGKSEYDAQTVQTRLAKMPNAGGDPNKGLEAMVANANATATDSKKTNPATGLPRDQMPVINKDQVATLVDDLNNGNIDAMQPYSRDVLQYLGGNQQQAQTNQMKTVGHQQQPQQQLQAAHTRHEGSSLNEWLVLSGIKTN